MAFFVNDHLFNKPIGVRIGYKIFEVECLTDKFITVNVVAVSIDSEQHIDGIVSTSVAQHRCSVGRQLTAPEPEQQRIDQ